MRLLPPNFVLLMKYGGHTFFLLIQKERENENSGQSQRVIRDVALAERMLGGKRVTVSHEIGLDGLSQISMSLDDFHYLEFFSSCLLLELFGKIYEN